MHTDFKKLEGTLVKALINAYNLFITYDSSQKFCQESQDS